MTVSEGIGRFVSRLLYTIKSEAADWQKANAADLETLRRDKAVAEAELRHRLEIMEIRFAEECRRIRLEEERQTLHFAEFLASIDEMKGTMLEYYTSMPKPIALMIHHHAAELLKAAWHSHDARERLQQQTRFTDLMLRITEDLTDQAEGAPRKALPEKTLAFIQNQIE
jgi:hypothetical protein